MTIGRAPGVTWTLPDPTRIISKQHCRIDAVPDGFTITDTSTNGLFVNEQPIGSRSTRRLADGDLVRLGDIVIAVGVEAAERVAPNSVPLPDGPFSEDESPVVAKPEVVEPLPAAGAPIAEDWWKKDSVAGDTTAHPDSGSPSHSVDAIVVSLIESFPEIDVNTLAQGLDVAGAVINDREWQAFYDRLRSYLRERYAENL